MTAIGPGSGATRRQLNLRSCFGEPWLDVMTFLNEVVADFPSAVSFAPGRPLDALLEVETHLAAARTFVTTIAGRAGREPAAVWNELGQYSRCNGIAGNLIAEHLAIDEGIEVAPDRLIVTVGAQEAMAIVLLGLFEPSQDILLVSDPTYVGITALARLLGIRVVPVPTPDSGTDPVAVAEAIRRASRFGRVRAFYDIPDFNNPLGTSLSLPARRALLAVCARHDVLIIEDNAYGMFAYDHERLPTLKALDQGAHVLYIGSLAKTLFPGLRLGYLIADQDTDTAGVPLATALSRVKSLLTVNTPPLTQAILGGVLLQHHGSLAGVVERKRVQYKANRDDMLRSIGRSFAGVGDAVTWSVPAGGFFMSMTLPFEFGAEECRACADRYGVLVCPMRFFCLDAERSRQIRLSFSYVQGDEIGEGIERLAAYVRHRMA